MWEILGFGFAFKQVENFTICVRDGKGGKKGVEGWESRESSP